MMDFSKYCTIMEIYMNIDVWELSQTEFDCVELNWKRGCVTCVNQSKESF